MSYISSHRISCDLSDIDGTDFSKKLSVCCRALDAVPQCWQLPGATASRYSSSVFINSLKNPPWLYYQPDVSIDPCFNSPYGGYDHILDALSLIGGSPKNNTGVKIDGKLPRGLGFEFCDIIGCGKGDNCDKMAVGC